MAQRKAPAGKARPTAISVAVVHPCCAMRRGLAAMVNEVHHHRATVVVPDANGLLAALRKGTVVHMALVAVPSDASDDSKLLMLLHQHYPAVRTLALCPANDDAAPGLAMLLHARTVLHEGVEAAELLQALLDVMAHDHHRSALLLRLYADRKMPASRRPAVRLTERERLVLTIWSDPLVRTRAQLAKRIGVSVNTVKTFLQNLYDKTGGSGRLYAMRWWAQHRNAWK